MNLKRNAQHGSVWIILLVAIGGVSAAWLYSQHQQEQKRIAQQVEQDRVKAIEQAKREAERLELERRQKKEKAEQDALTEANGKLDALLTRWADARSLAGTTGRIALAQPVAALQQIRREVAALTLSPCMDDAKSKLVTSMGHTIEGFIEFMRNEMKIGDKLAQIEFDAAAAMMRNYTVARESCSH